MTAHEKDPRGCRNCKHGFETGITEVKNEVSRRRAIVLTVWGCRANACHELSGYEPKKPELNWEKRPSGRYQEHCLEIELKPPRKVCLFVTERGQRLGRGPEFSFAGYVDHGDGGHDYILEGDRSSLEEAKRAAVSELRSFCTECLAALGGVS